jgi:hypothetical protein
MQYAIMISCAKSSFVNDCKEIHKKSKKISIVSCDWIVIDSVEMFRRIVSVKLGTGDDCRQQLNMYRINAEPKLESNDLLV